MSNVEEQRQGQPKAGNVTTIVYAALMPGLQALAAEHGYALAVHGSIARDFDLVAVPWVDAAQMAEVLVDALTVAFANYLGGGLVARAHGPALKPHGRMAWTIPIGVGLAVDLSVMPLAEVAP